MNRKGLSKWGAVGMTILVIAALFAVAWFAGVLPGDTSGSGAATKDTQQQIELGQEGVSCIGINNVAVTYDDQDEYTPGTDPGVGNLFVLTDRKGSLAEGSNTLYANRNYEALAGQNATAYFAEPVQFRTGCQDSPLSIEVAKAGAPTVTFINSDGVTKNTDANAEDMAASSSYDFEMTVKAPSKQCTSRHGMLIVGDIDKTYVSKLESATLSGGDAPDFLAHVNGDNSTSDGFVAFQYDGQLCNGEKITVPFKMTTTSTTVGEGNANVVFHVIPLNYDVDATTYKVIGPAAEDEDNNAITLGNVTAEFHSY